MRTVQAEQQPIIEVGGIVDAVLVEDEGIGQRADLQQPMPVGRVARQARHLQAHHDPGPPQAHLGDQVLEALARARGGARLPEIRIDDEDLIELPPERDGAMVRWRRSYWRWVLSVFSNTCRNVD